MNRSNKEALIADLASIRADVRDAWRRETKPIFAKEFLDLLARIDRVTEEIKGLPVAEDLVHARIEEAVVSAEIYYDHGDDCIVPS